VCCLADSDVEHKTVDRSHSYDDDDANADDGDDDLASLHSSDSALVHIDFSLHCLLLPLTFMLLE